MSTGCSGTPLNTELLGFYSWLLIVPQGLLGQNDPEMARKRDELGLQERVFEVVMQHRAESFNVARARPARGTKTTEIQALGSNNGTQNYPAQIADVLFTRQPTYP